MDILNDKINNMATLLCTAHSSLIITIIVGSCKYNIIIYMHLSTSHSMIIDKTVKLKGIFKNISGVWNMENSTTFFLVNFKAKI